MLAQILCAHFCENIYFILVFVQNLNHFWFSTFRNFWMKIVSKDFCAFIGISIRPFTWARLAGPTSCLSDNLELPKCWTGEFPHRSCPISNCPTVQTFDIFFSVVWELACPLYLLILFLISSNLSSCLLWLNSEYWLTCQLCRFRCKSATE